MRHAGEPDRLTALVALREPGEGKTRLASLLSSDERAAVARAMAADVTDALRAAGVPEVLVVAEGPRAARFAHDLGLPVLRDRSARSDLNAAFTDALTAVDPGRTVLLVCADLPGLTAGDVTAVLAADAEVVVAPTHDGGTGGLLLRPGVRIELAYGPGSAAAHRRRAALAGRTGTEVVVPGFHHDVDRPVHLHETVARWPSSQTGRVVAGWLDRPGAATA